MAAGDDLVDAAICVHERDVVAELLQVLSEFPRVDRRSKVRKVLAVPLGYEQWATVESQRGLVVPVTLRDVRRLVDQSKLVFDDRRIVVFGEHDVQDVRHPRPFRSCGLLPSIDGELRP